MTDTEFARRNYQQLATDLKEMSLLGSISGVLGWDERVMLPDRGAELRGDQLALLAKLKHQRMTSNRIGDLLAALETSSLIQDSFSDAAVNIRETRRLYDRARKLPESLVEEQTRLSVMAQQAWVEARKNADFKSFSPWLEKTLALKLQEANCVGYQEHPYDSLLDEFEPGATAAQLRGIFDSLRQPLVELIKKITSSGRSAPVEILERHFPVNMQEKLAREAAAKVGFDFQAGRLDVSVHPFCSGNGPGDTRLTTRYDDHYFGDAFFGVLHETGHGLYHQGLPKEYFGTPLGDDISLGIHESQSRLWENLVGRSRSFWRFFLPRAKAVFPEALNNVTDEQWYRAINDVRPSFIRTESDETTYNLHILLRFELELAMMSGDLQVRDLPAAWNLKMKTYLGIEPPDASKGVLQDIHWSGGAIGYFPTYTLGNLYAAQFFQTAQKQLGDLDEMFSRGEFQPLLQWLRKNIHQHGKRYSAGQLVEKVTGEDLSAMPLLKHLHARANEVYGV